MEFWSNFDKTSHTFYIKKTNNFHGFSVPTLDQYINHIKWPGFPDLLQSLGIGTDPYEVLLANRLFGKRFLKRTKKHKSPISELFFSFRGKSVSHLDANFKKVPPKPRIFESCSRYYSWATHVCHVLWLVTWDIFVTRTQHPFPGCHLARSSECPGFPKSHPKGTRKTHKKAGVPIP